MMLQSRIWLALAIFAPVVASATTVYDSYNVGLPVQNGQNSDNCCKLADTDIGWYYTPSSSYTLQEIDTLFDTLGTNATITVAVYTDRPAVGGTLLGSASWATTEGTLGGPTFSTGIPLVAGTTYFIGFEGVLNVGVNQVTFESTGVEGTPPGSIAPSETYQDVDGSASFSDVGCTDLDNWFCKPILQFVGPDLDTTPEPGTITLIGGGLALLAFAARRKKR